ncbi:MAG: S-layer homology domain-containing protein [Thermoleophilia bacterium]
MLLRRAVMVVVVGAVLLLGISGVAWGLSLPSTPGKFFLDVTPGGPYSEAVDALAEVGVVDGYGDGKFGLMNLVLRQQFTKMMAKTLDLSAPDLPMPFVDVEEGLSETDPMYPSGYVAMCWAAGITKGKDATHFAPYENMTRHQLVTMAVRSVQSRLKAPPEDWTGTFPSDDPIHGANVRLAEYNGLLDDVTFGRLTTPPCYWLGLGVSASRGECAGVLYNVWTLLAASE